MNKVEAKSSIRNGLGGARNAEIRSANFVRMPARQDRRQIVPQGHILTVWEAVELGIGEKLNAQQDRTQKTTAEIKRRLAGLKSDNKERKPYFVRTAGIVIRK